MLPSPCLSRLVIYYVTDDLHNTREYNEIELLRRIAPVVIVTQPGSARHPLGLKQIGASVPCGWRASWLQSWARLSFLLCRVGQGEIDKRFPERNLFTGGLLFRRLVNFFWSIKSSPLVSRVLPTYNNLFFAPLRWMHLFSKTQRMPQARQRVVVFDAVLNRIAHFAPFIEQQRQRGAILVANVKSWDNAFYARVATEADGFLVWSPAIWNDLQQTHHLKSSHCLAWGARAFVDFYAQSREHRQPKRGPDHPLTLGYAAAYAHPRMARSEAQIIAQVAHQLRARMPEARLLFRPYPSTDPEAYSALSLIPGVEVQSIEGPVQDRFGDGREAIRFGSPAEKVCFLSRCDAFLSLATSFTFEAALQGCPIIQLALAPAQRQSSAEQELFRWVDNSDHLQRYFMRDLPLAQSYSDLVTSLAHLDTLQARSAAATARLIQQLCLPGSPQQPTEAELVLQLRQFLLHLQPPFLDPVRLLDHA